MGDFSDLLILGAWEEFALLLATLPMTYMVIG